jgi:hypothetical protein
MFRDEATMRDVAVWAAVAIVSVSLLTLVAWLIWG